MVENKRGVETGTGNSENQSAQNYPERPAWEDFPNQVQVIFNELVVADSRQAVRLVERGQAPVYFIPQLDVMMKCLRKNGRSQQHPVLGEAFLYTLRVGERIAEDAAWAYLEPNSSYARVKGYIAFDPNLVDACLVNGETATPQHGGSHGWITASIHGPFIGE